MKKIKLPFLKYQIIAMIVLLSFSCIAAVSATEITVGSAGEDYSNISAALANATDGDIIAVSDGTYNENIVVDHEVTIRSQTGAANTIINSSPDSDAVNITASNVTINGFTVKGASASSLVGIYLDSNSNCSISNNIVTGNYYGIVLDSSNNNSLTDNNVNSNDKSGIVLDSSSNNNLTGNNAIDNHNYGISVSHSSGNKLTGNNASGDYYGIQFYYADSNELIGNNASCNDIHGIYLSSSNNNELTGNNAVDNPSYGIYLTSSSSNTLTSNDASDNDCGIRFSSSDNNNLTNNNASNNDCGIRFFSSSSNNLTGNMMLSNTYNFNVNVFNSDLNDLLNDIDDSNTVDGKPIYYWTNRANEEVPSDAGLVYVVNSTNITVKDTEVTNEYSGINFVYTTNSTIENATISECDRGIYLRYSDNNDLTGNNASYNDDGMYLEYSDSNNLTNNDVSYNSDDGIYLYYADNNDMITNTASHNADDGIYLYYADNNNLTSNNASYNDAEGMYLALSINNHLTGNDANENDCGICISSGNNNNLTNNNANNNNNEGILIRSSDNNNLTGNNASDNNYGLCLYSSNNNNLTSNTMSSNVYNLYVSSSNLDDYIHDIDDSNTVNSKPVYYWTNRADEEVPSSAGVVYVVNSVNITVKDIEVTNEFNGVMFAYTTNSTIENITTSECNYGIYLRYSDYNNLTSNNASYNDDYGIFFYYSDYNNLTHNNADNNNYAGIYFRYSDYNDLTSNNASDNDKGIYFRSSDYNNLTNNTANNNNENDLYVYYSGSCTVDRFVLTANSAQLSFFADSSSTSINGSETNANALSGKTNVNGYASIDHYGNLNVTFFYDDSGMSNSGESSVALYRLDGSTWAEVPNTSLNTSGNYLSATLSEFGTFGLFRNTEPSSSSSLDSSSSGTRASVSQGQDPAIVKTTAASTLRVVKGTEVNYDFSDSNTSVLGVSFDAKNDEGLVVAKVQVLSDSPEDIPSPSGTSYQLMSIDIGTEGTISTNNANNVLIHFKVSREWIEENDIDVSTIHMTRFHNQQWQDLPTTQAKEDGEFIYFTAETPGFSIFEIVGNKTGDVISVKETGYSIPVDEYTESETTETKNTPGFTGIAGIAIVSIAFLMIRKLKSD